MPYVKPLNVPPPRASRQDVDSHPIQEETYMRGIYEDYHAHELAFDNETRVEGIVVNLDTVQQEVVVDKQGEGGIEVLDEGEDVGLFDKEKLESAVNNSPLVVVGLAQELGEENLEDAALDGADLPLIQEVLNLPLRCNPRKMLSSRRKHAQGSTQIHGESSKTVARNGGLLMGNEVAEKSADLPVGMSYPELAVASTLCDLKASGGKSYHRGEGSRAGTEAALSVNAQYLIIEESPPTGAPMQHSTRGGRGGRGIESVEGSSSVSKDGSDSLGKGEDREGEREPTIDSTGESRQPYCS